MLPHLLYGLKVVDIKFWMFENFIKFFFWSSGSTIPKIISVCLGLRNECYNNSGNVWSVSIVGRIQRNVFDLLFMRIFVCVPVCACICFVYLYTCVNVFMSFCLFVCLVVSVSQLKKASKFINFPYGPFLVEFSPLSKAKFFFFKFCWTKFKLQNYIIIEWKVNLSSPNLPKWNFFPSLPPCMKNHYLYSHCPFR